MIFTLHIYYLSFHSTVFYSLGRRVGGRTEHVCAMCGAILQYFMRTCGRYAPSLFSTSMHIGDGEVEIENGFYAVKTCWRGRPT